jgi:membrane fusion protein (multidrug efflux system)
MAVVVMVALAGCGRRSEDGPPATTQAGAANAAQNTRGGRPSRPPIPVAVESVRTGSIASYYSATATLEAEREAEILARVSGVIETLLCEEGDRITAGQSLLRIDNDEYRLRLAQAEARTANLESRHERLKGMWDQKLVSAEEYETVKNDLQSAEAEEDVARLNVSYTTVTAPFTGRVIRRLVDVGQNVSAGTPLFVLADFDPLLARVYVPSKEFKKLKPDQKVRLVLDSNRTGLEGRIKLVSPIIDPTSGTIKITVEIPRYPQGTRPGDFAEVRIVTERRTGSILVPKNAVFTDRGDKILFVAAADSTAERRVVEVGFEDDEQAEILSGVSPAEQVVVKGQRSLKHGAPLKIMSAQPPSANASKKEKAGT